MEGSRLCNTNALVSALALYCLFKKLIYDERIESMQFDFTFHPLHLK